jgi:hypothetical protein
MQLLGKETAQPFGTGAVSRPGRSNLAVSSVRRTSIGRAM